ncbi:MAG TPA: MASE1 domain-containing protein [Pyrinomonadaceae bacterium]|nr:MASE1 domain-containing protein [Pyrinomonadaceae bacterium]
MSQLVVNTIQPIRDSLKIRREMLLRSLLAAVLVGGGYYIGAKIGFALTFQPYPVSTLWPPNSILLAALLLSRTRSWWYLLLAAFPAHLLVQLNADIPMTMILCWFVSNCSEALIGASILRYLTGSEVRFDITHHVSMFILIAFFGPFLSSFIDAGFVMLNQFENSSYWQVFRMRFFSNMLATLTLVPLIITWRRFEFASLRNNSWTRYLEAGLLVASFLIVQLVSFSSQSTGPDIRPAFLYLPLPLLLWAAIRFGPRGSSSALIVVSIFEIWAAIRGLGPFATQSPELNALSVQLFLILTSLPLMLLAASIKERERAQEASSQKGLRLELALDAAQQASQALNESQEKLHQSHNQIRKLLGKLIDAQEAERRRISRELHDDLNQKIATLSMSISRLKRNVPMQDRELIAELDRLRQTANALTNEVRRLSHQLHPAVLEHLGLVTALESYIVSFSDEERIDVQLTADVGDERIPFQTSICLYRVAVEALRNVARHSGAESAAVSLTRISGNWELRVSDSGKGFDVETLAQSGGLGLISVEERLRLLQGSCEISSTSEHGTTLVVRVPLAA